MTIAAAPKRSPLILVVAASLLAGCATTHYGNYAAAERDPLEKFNRTMWGVNMKADHAVLRPVTKAYRSVAPRPVRQGLTNFFSNLTEPWSFVNNVLQAHPRRALQNVTRFTINTIFGLGGLFDNASRAHVAAAPEDLGQTFATWGINGGPYLVLPLLGPSSLRDGIGSGVAYFADPVSIGLRHLDVSIWAKRGYGALGIVSARSNLTESGGDAFLDSSLDSYAAAKSAYLQRRTAQIRNQDDDTLDAGPPDEPMPADGAPMAADAPAATAPPVTAPPSTPPSAAPVAPTAGPANPVPQAGTPKQSDMPKQ